MTDILSQNHETVSVSCHGGSSLRLAHNDNNLSKITFIIKTMNKTYKFRAEIKKVPDINGAYVVFPYDIKKEFGKGRVKVNVLFDGIPYSGSIVNMGIKNVDGSVCYIIGILKEIRKKINKQAGDLVEVEVNAVD